MNLPYVTTLIMLMCTGIEAQTQSYTLEVEVVGIKTDRGTILGYLFNADSSFLRRPIQSVSMQSKITDRVYLKFADLSSNTYAINIYHDVNDNKALDTNWMRKPSEPYGFSNNPKMKFRPPNFDETRFLLTSDMSITIHLR